MIKDKDQLYDEIDILKQSLVDLRVAANELIDAVDGAYLADLNYTDRIIILDAIEKLKDLVNPPQNVIPIQRGMRETNIRDN